MAARMRAGPAQRRGQATGGALTDRERSCVPFSSRRRRRSTTSRCVSSKGRRTWAGSSGQAPPPPRGPAPRPRPAPHTHLRQPQGALVLDAVVGQGQPEQGAVQPQALGDVARALVPDEVETQVERDQRPVAAVQRGQSPAQELRPVVVDVVVPQGQVRDPVGGGRRQRALGSWACSGPRGARGGPWGLRRRGRSPGSLGRCLRGKEGRGLGVTWDGSRPRGGVGTGASRAVQCHELVVGLLRQRVALQRHLPVNQEAPQ